MMIDMFAAALLGMAAQAPAQDAPAGRPSSTPAKDAWRGTTSFRDIEFVPEGWKLYDKAIGDLDGDGRSDSVLIIQKNDPALVIRNKNGFGMDRYDSNPRKVLVILQDYPGQYKLVAKGDAIIPDHDSPTISDPFENVRIEKGSLHLDIAFFANAGSWSMYNRRFQFRWDGKAMALIGFEMTYVHRASGEMNQTSVNYLSGKRKDSKGNIADSEENWKWSKVPKGTAHTLGSIGNGFEFEG
ncbi:MAG: hypothetical protein ABJ242_06250 [Marinomonas sp.]|uniref:hypothetical protein n=1 Tax=Parasphingorhabdus sp. TaxID=2709688 RepID=UPI00328A2B83